MRSYIIRLDQNVHSCNMAKDCFDQSIKHGIQPHYFSAIHGNTVEQHYSVTGVPKPVNRLKKGRIGVLGCFFSHYYLWRKCLEVNEPIVILEHDGYFIRNLPDDICNQFDDVLKLDGHDPYSKQYNNIIEADLNSQIRVEKYKHISSKDITKIGTGNYFKGAYSYILKPQGAEKLINFVHNSKTGHRPADQQIGDAVLNTWVTVPTVARLHPFYSIGNNIKSASLTQNLI